MIDRQGHFVVAPSFDYLTDLYPNGRAAGYRVDPNSDDDYDGFYYSVDKNGKVGEPNRVYENILNIDDEGIEVNGSSLAEDPHNVNPDFIPAYQNDKYGYKNAEGQWVIPPKWHYAASFDKNVAFVFEKNWSGGKWGLINTKGEYLLKPTCIAVWFFREDRARCKVRFVNGKLE